MTESERQRQEPAPEITLANFQQLIRAMYSRKDEERGISGTFMWLMEEMGELAAAVREGTHQEQSEEFADVLAWLSTLASIAEIDLEAAAAEKYAGGCPKCGSTPCAC